MKVLLVSPLPPPEGGIATWTAKYKKYCEENSLQISIVDIALKGARGKKINAKKNYFDEVGRTVSILRDLKTRIKKIEPNVIHINTSCSKFGLFRDYFCCKIASRNKIPIVLQCHCNVTRQIKNKFAIHIFKKMSNLSSRVLTLNSLSNDYVNALVANSSIIIPNFIDNEMVNDSFVARDELKEIVFIGHVQKTKGSVEILEAAKFLPQYHFTLVGPVSEEISKLECPDNVSLVGTKKLEEVKQYLVNSDVFLFPSYTEGFSIALTEAMAVGLPAIATDVGSNEDMLENKGGIIIPAKDSGAIVEAIEKLKDKSIRQAMSDWNVSKVKDNYLVDRVMEQFLNVYSSVVNNGE